jgi:3-hydroxybutyryl-CoA dehydrogenase
VSQPIETSPSAQAPSTGGGLSETVAIAGSGTIACALAACVAHNGGEVVLWARSSESADRARQAIARSCEKLGDAGRDVRVTDDFAELSHATLAVEAVIEQEAPKREVVRRLSAMLSDGSLIATTTSSLSVSTLADASGRPESFFGLHVFNPVHRMELVELCFPSGAQPETRARARALCEAIGKQAVEVPDQAGFVVNRLLFPYLFDAVRLLERTGLEPDQVDACMRLGASHPMGPLELLDFVGLDVAEAIGEALHADTGDAAHFPPGRIKQLVREGRLGRKAGSGFYEYG